ncbi:AI-2E family transporter [Paenibacillus sp. GCM10023252]|uniref:AI-2E family transporter n=1 Tax=Paenibacillus sp. GCM10023252 TaxID=3252649 RepID=UPI0036118F26
MPQSRFFRIGYGVLLVFLIIWVGVKINFIFYPLQVLFQTMFAPILISGVLFYLMRPMVNDLTERRVPRVVAILIVFLAAGCMITLLVLFVAPVIQRQFTELLESLPTFIESVTDGSKEIVEDKWLNQFLSSLDLDLNQITARFSQYAMQFLNVVGTNLQYLINLIANLVVLLVTIPLILFYLLKDSDKISSGMLWVLPLAKRKHGRTMLAEIDTTISTYIRGQLLVALCVGVMLFIGYLIIGIDYAFLLALTAMLTNVIPYLGAFIAAVPAILIALTDSPMMVLYVLIVIVISQQLEGNLISPQIMGKQMDIHPLTIIILLLVAGSLLGIVGLLLAVPFYAIMKTVVMNGYKFLRMRSEPDEDDEDANKDNRVP